MAFEKKLPNGVDPLTPTRNPNQALFRRSFATIAIVGFAILALPGCGAGCGPDIPETTTCETPTEAGITRLFAGNQIDGVFVPFAEGDTLDLTWGPQGSPMFVIWLSFAGPDVPNCIAQNTLITLSGKTTVVAAEEAAVLTQLQNDASRLTEPMYLVISEPENGINGQNIVLTVESNGLKFSRNLVVAGTRPVDAQPVDASMPDAF